MNQIQHLIENFKSNYQNFQLGVLTTESVNPLSSNLSFLSQKDLSQAIDAIKQIDLRALKILFSLRKPLQELAVDIKETLENGFNIYLFGCGSTGRLSISLEFFCRSGLISEKYKEKIISFMSGGDLALIRSIENFEDYPLYGANHLMELGFKDGDLLISTTEGGETPIVIGATEKASEISIRNPYFLYCNSDEILVSKVERSKKVILNSKIKKIPILIEPMALSGSTRMQASTVLMLAIGAAIHSADSKEPVENMIENIIKFYEKLNILPLQKFIESESSIYLSKEFLVYLTTKHFGVTILTDTTERSPTFTLNCFENTNNELDPMSLCYVSLKESKSSEETWQLLLGRKPRCLEWDFCKNITGYKRLLGYDISERIVEIRRKGNQNQHFFSIYFDSFSKNTVLFHLLEQKWSIYFEELNLFETNIILKMILNIHSTLVMGRIGRYESNVMTYVKPSNFKLIDRTIRYIKQILKEKHSLEINYEKIMENLTEAANDIKEEEPFVLKATNYILGKHFNFQKD